MIGWLAWSEVKITDASFFAKGGGDGYGDGYGSGHDSYGKGGGKGGGTSCVVKGSYCQCHYCKCEHGHLNCGKKGGYGHEKGLVENETLEVLNQSQSTGTEKNIAMGQWKENTVIVTTANASTDLV